MISTRSPSAIALVRRAFRFWLGQQYDAVDGGAEALQGRDVAHQVGHQNPVEQDSLRAVRSWSDLSTGLNGDLPYSVQKAEKGSVLEIEKRCLGAGDCGNSACDAGNALDWRRDCGFVGHDGVPWLWEARRGCWLAATESSRAGDYARLLAENCARALGASGGDGAPR